MLVRLHVYLNIKRVFGCTVNESALIPTYFVINYKFKGISVIIIFYVFLL